MEKQYRYPGTRPFLENDRHLFFGRKNDIKQLSELIILEKLVVLFSKSGYGKSSLLNAGVIPRLSEKENHKVLNIRLNEQDRNPVELLVHHLKNHETQKLWLSAKFNLTHELPDELAAKLWYYAKNIQLANEGCKSVTLVFDQFEELFNYSREHVQEFGKTIATLLNLNMPEAVRLLMKQKMKTDADYFTDAETDQLLEPLNLKVVFSLRNDRLSLLNQLKTYLPAIFKKTYELQPLDEMQALEALLEPATKEGNFASPPFTYTDAATKLILESLKDSEHQRIETFQLQLICQHAEELIIQKAAKDPASFENPQDFKKLTISDIELGKPEDIFEKHYKIIIDSLPENHQYAARVLIEDKLIIGGNRVPLPETVITQQHNIAAALLKTLVDKRLLRSEPNTVGGTSYELSHDTLVAPITKAAEVRRQKEEEARAEAERREELRLAHEKAEKERVEREKERKRQRTIILIVTVAALVSIAFGIYGFVQKNKAEKQTEIAKEALDKVDLALRKEALIYMETGEYKLAKSKFIYLRDVILNGKTTPALEKRIKECDELSQVKQLYDTLLVQAKMAKEAKNYPQAVDFYEKAMQTEIDKDNKNDFIKSQLKDLLSITTELAAQHTKEANALQELPAYKTTQAQIRNQAVQMQNVKNKINLLINSQQ